MSSSWNADLYNQKHAFVHQYGANLVEFLDPKAGEVILDLGCGTGQLTRKIARSGARVIGIDSSLEMIEAAREQYPELEFKLQDAETFSFDFLFDAVFSNAAMHWIKDQNLVVERMHQQLKQGGRLAVEFGGQGNVERILNALRKEFQERGHQQQALYDPWFFPSISEYTGLLEAVGFEVTFAQLYDRPTMLESEDSGISDWLEMFAGNFFEGIDQEERATIKREVQEKLRDECFSDGKWYADYRRIRVFAIKQS